MTKIKVRYIKGFGIIGSLHNVEILKPISGFGYSKKLYCCDNCGEIFILDLDDPDLKGLNERPKKLDGHCLNCKKTLEGHLVSYPQNVFLSGSVEKMDKATISFDPDHSLVKEFWVL